MTTAKHRRSISVGLGAVEWSTKDRSFGRVIGQTPVRNLNHRIYDIPTEWKQVARRMEKKQHFSVWFSEEDGEWVAEHAAYPSLSWLDSSPEVALASLMKAMDDEGLPYK